MGNQQREPAEDAASPPMPKFCAMTKSSIRETPVMISGVDDRHIADVVDDELAFAGHRVDADGSQCTQYGSYHAGYQRQYQAEAQRREDHFVVEQALVPVQGKAGEVGTGLALVKAKGNHDRDGQVHEAEHQDDIGALQENRLLFVHLTSPLPSRTHQSWR